MGEKEEEVLISWEMLLLAIIAFAIIVFMVWRRFQ